MAKGNLNMWQPSSESTFHGPPMSKSARKLTPEGRDQLRAEALRDAAMQEEKPEVPAPRLNPQKYASQGQETPLQAAQRRYNELAAPQAVLKNNKGLLVLLGAVIAGSVIMLSQKNDES